MWVGIVVGIALVIFLLVLACLRMAKQSEEQYPRVGVDQKLNTLFACAHIWVDVQLQGLKQLLKNQGCGQVVIDAVHEDAKGIHAMINSNRQAAETNKLEAEFYLVNEESYRNMLKGLVGCMADIDGYEEGQKLINDWIQLHDDWIADHRNHES